LENIKSTHIIQTIFNYTDDILKFKLFSYSKKYQKQLNLDLFDYQAKFFDKIKMNSFYNYFKYLCVPESIYNFTSNYSSYKDGKTELLKKDLSKYNINIDDFKNYVKNYFVKYKEKIIKEINEEYLIKKNDKDKYEYISGYRNDEEIRGFQEFSEGIKLEIDINSPLFDIFYKSQLFGELFVIPINIRFIEEYKLKEDYITAFNKLNDINSNYTSIFLKCDEDNKNISYLKDFNIKFNKIKNLSITIKRYDYQKNFDYNLFYRELFSLKDIENNIIDLYINNDENYRNEIDGNIFENINKFKKLENLKLYKLSLNNIFELKLKTLKSLNIEGSKNIYINPDAGLSLKKLILPFYNIYKSLLKLPQLEYLELSESIESDYSSIDLNSLNNLKKIKFESHDAFPQIFSIKSLKEIDFTSDDLYYLEDAFASIHDKNYSVNKLIYKYIKDYHDPNYNIDEILNKFPNITELIFITNITSYRMHKLGWEVFEYSEINLEIKENSNSKINKITLFLYFGDTKVDCQSFESLEKFEIETFKILNISNSNCIPMLSNNRNIIYNSLTELKLHIKRQLIYLEIFKKLNNSIDNMPNLKKIDLLFMTNLDRNTYEEFIKKILSLKLEFINIDFHFHDESCKDIIEEYSDIHNYSDYSYEELKIINKSKLNLNYENIKIKKYHKENLKFLKKN